MATATPEFAIERPKIDGTTALAIVDNSAVILRPVMDVETAIQRLAEFQEFTRRYMIEGEDFGKIPGVKKPSLFKPGAEKLCELYGLADTYPENRIRRIENWNDGLFFYEITCVLKKKGTEIVVGEGMGSCSTYESRYRYRDAARKCPKCAGEFIIKGKDEYGGGWLCWKKKGGCGATFSDGDQTIESQALGKVQNDNLHDVINTVLKMAKKRAKVDAVIAATRSSGIFTQDVEDQGVAAAAPEEAKDTSTTILGTVAAVKDVKGQLWLRVVHMDRDRQEAREFHCGVPADRKDLREKLVGSQGMQVELLTDDRTAGTKPHYRIKGVIDIGYPQPVVNAMEITDEDIPF